MQQKPSPRTSGRSRNSVLILLSGESTTLPEAEARAVVHAYDSAAEVTKPEGRIVLADTDADPDLIAGRIAFARRVGQLIPDGKLTQGQLHVLKGSTYRMRMFALTKETGDFEEITSRFVSQTDAKIELENPDFEVSVACGSTIYFALTRPRIMRQGWVLRRPRSRAFFHPAAIFPKLSRALVNLTEVRKGETLLDPYAGTGSLLIEGSIVGAACVGIDISRKMVMGALANRRKLGLEWLGLMRGDSSHPPVRWADAVVTDVPYGRASSPEGRDTTSHLASVMKIAESALRVGGKAVVMHPKELAVNAPDNLDLEEEHHLYVHRRLTRTISVLRRTRV